MKRAGNFDHEEKEDAHNKRFSVCSTDSDSGVGTTLVGTVPVAIYGFTRGGLNGVYDPTEELYMGVTILDIRKFVQNAGDVARMAKMLLEDRSIADVNARDVTWHNFTALLYHARHGTRHSVEWLLRQGALVNVCNDFGFTPLHLAVDSGDAEKVCVLLAHGADKAATCARGDTPICLLAKKTSLSKLKKTELYDALQKIYNKE